MRPSINGFANSLSLKYLLKKAFKFKSVWCFTTFKRIEKYGNPNHIIDITLFLKVFHFIEKNK